MTAVAAPVIVDVAPSFLAGRGSLLAIGEAPVAEGCGLYPGGGPGGGCGLTPGGIPGGGAMGGRMVGGGPIGGGKMGRYGEVARWGAGPAVWGSGRMGGGPAVGEQGSGQMSLGQGEPQSHNFNLAEEYWKMMRTLCQVGFPSITN